MALRRAAASGNYTVESDVSVAFEARLSVDTDGGHRRRPQPVLELTGNAEVGAVVGDAGVTHPHHRPGPSFLLPQWRTASSRSGRRPFMPQAS